MNKTTVKLSASTIYQLEAGEHKAVTDNGDLYILVQSVEGASGGEVKDPGHSHNPAPSRGSQPKEESTGNKSYTEDEMMDMESDDLLDILKGFGINASHYSGKNTNKKLRTLILDYQSGKLEEPEGGEEAEQAPAPARGRGRQAEVVNDTEEEEAPTSGRARASRGSRAEKSNEPVEIAPEKWENLKENDMVLVKLDLEGEDADKLWEAQIVGWDVPKGMKEEQLYVLFLEDNTEDYLRPEDKLYEYQKQL